MPDFKAKNAPDSLSVGAPSQTPLGSLQCSPDPYLYLRGLLLWGRRGREG